MDLLYWFINTEAVYLIPFSFSIFGVISTPGDGEEKGNPGMDLFIGI